MKKFLVTTVAIGLFLGIQTVSADDISNLTVNPAGSQLLIQWDALPETTLSEVEGYALQWSSIQSDIRNDKSVRLPTLSTSKTSHSIYSFGFEKNTKYYFRIYTFIKDGREYILTNGSQILQWEKKSSGEIETEYLDANDPVIAASNSGANATVSEEFSNIGITEFDTRARFEWSQPNLTKSDYEGYKIVLSKNTDMSAPISEFSLGRDNTRLFVQGLDPETTYNATGYFYKRVGGADEKFGKSETKSFQTAAKFTARQEQSYQRTISRWAKSGLVGFKKNIDGTNASSVTTSTTAATTTSTATPAAPVDTSDKTAVQSRISEIQTEIRTLQAELRKLQNSSGTSTSSTAQTSTATTSTMTTTGRVIRTPVRKTNWKSRFSQ
ncbi:hypothetical protein HOA64_02055 [bacterium]|jgi:hypothetical protein|nr:hypothetical protein [bacterium]MBT7772480.1 hypothetical protein [bacterium]